YTLLPGGDNFVTVAAGQSLSFSVKFNYRLTRANSASIWLIVRRQETGATGLTRVFTPYFSAGSSRIETNASSLSLTLPSPAPGLLEFFLAFGPDNLNSSYPANQVFAISSSLLLLYGTEFPKPDLSVDHIELLQVVQDKDNSIPLIG